MKIGDVKIGERYAAVDEPTRRYGGVYGGELPREVEAVEIVTREERQRGYGYMQNQEPPMRKVRLVSVRVIGGTPREYGGYRWPVACAEPDATIVIPAKKLLGPWADVSPKVAAEIKLRADRETLKETLDARLAALLPSGESYANVAMYGGTLRADLRIEGDDIERLLALAEKGATA